MKTHICRIVLAVLTGVAVSLAGLRTAAADTGPREGVYLREKSFGTGYAWAGLDDGNSGDLEIYHNFLRFGFDIDTWVGLEGHKGNLQLVLEPFASPIASPDDIGIATGMGVFFTYSYPLLESLSAYVEGGAAPMYFGIDTQEQGSSGFEFWDQGGAGLQFFFNDNKAVNVGYRFYHISNGSTSSPNSGINGSMATVGVSLFY